MTAGRCLLEMSFPGPAPTPTGATFRRCVGLRRHSGLGPDDGYVNASPQADTEGPRGGLCGVPPVALMPLLLHSRRVLALLPVRGKGELRFAASLGELTRAGCSPGPLVCLFHATGQQSGVSTGGCQWAEPVQSLYRRQMSESGLSRLEDDQDWEYPENHQIR